MRQKNKDKNRLMHHGNKKSIKAGSLYRLVTSKVKVSDKRIKQNINV